MSDQAERLRQIVNGNSRKRARVITITSGKGGVGKSNITLNLALALKELNKKVVILDADLGLANIDVLLGISTKMNLSHVIHDKKTIWEVLHKSEYGVDIVAGGSGINDLMNLGDDDLVYFLEQITTLNEYADYIIIDTGAGLSKESSRFIMSADEVLLVTTPEPTAITDAYAVVKMVNNIRHNIKYKLIVNRVNNKKEGVVTANKLELVSKRFLNIDLPMLGYIIDDKNVQKAVKKQLPFYTTFPKTEASLCLTEIAKRLVEQAPFDEAESGVGGFMSRMLSLLK